MLTHLDASAVRRWCTAALQSMEVHREEIDDLNVFPIPDGDTGTNLVMTLRSAADGVDTDRSATAAEVLQAMARGAVMGARGNSGVIVSQILRGLADGIDGCVEADATTLARGLLSAADAAYASVAEPVDGTILSVARAAADALASGVDTQDLATAITSAAAAARTALEHTTDQLQALSDAGVVDAGGRGLVVLLDAMAEVVTGEAADDTAPGRRRRSRSALERVREAGSDAYGYEVQYLIHADDDSIERLKQSLGDLGDCLVVVGAGNGLFNVHVHVNDVGSAIEAGIEVGRPSQITVSRFADQIAAEATDAIRQTTAIVAVAPGDGLADLFRSEGVVVVDGGPTSNPSTAEVLEAMLSAQASRLVVLPNASAVGGVVEMAATEARNRGLSVAVVPTKSPVQGLAAIAVHDAERRFEDDVIAMAETAASTHFAEVTVAVRDSITYAGRCQAGDILGLIEGEVVEIGSEVGAVGVNLVQRLINAGGELVTVLTGSDEGAQQAADLVERHVRTVHPLVEIAVFAGGQPHFPLLIGVE